MAMLRRQFAAALAATTGLGALGLTGCSTLGAPAPPFHTEGRSCSIGAVPS